MHDHRVKHLAPPVTVLAVGVAYAIGAQLSWSVFGSGSLGPAFFPPAGIALAALVLLPRRQWASILAVCAVAEVAVDTAHGVAVGVALGFALANVLEPLVGASLLARIGTPRPRLDTLSGLVRFAGCAVVIGPVVGAAVGTLVRVADGAHTHLGTDILTWWAGDALAVLVIGAPVVFFTDPRRDRLAQPRRREMFALWCTALAISVLGVLWHAVPLSWLVVPVMLWAALRLEVPGAFVAAPTVSIVLNWGVTNGHDPFQRFGDPSPRVQLLFAQGFGALAMFLAWVVGIERRERRMMQGEHFHAALLARVALVLQSPAGDDDSLLAELARTLTPDACDACTVRLARDGQLEVAAATAVDPHVEAILRRMPPAVIDTDPSTIGRAARSRTVVVDDFTADRHAQQTIGSEQRELVRDHVHSLMSVPMIARDQLVGVLSIAMLRNSGRVFSADDQALAEEFAARCALVLRERALRIRAERSEIRLQQLRRAIKALAGAETMDDVLRAVGEVGTEALDASRALVVARADDGFVLRSWSAPDGVAPAPRDEPPPLRRAIATSSTVLVSGHGALSEFGLVAAEAIGRTGRSWAAVPFPETWSVRGGLWLCFPEPQEFDAAHQDALTAYADSLGQTLERVRAQDEERRGREAAESRTALVSALGRAEAVGDVAEIVTAEGCRAAGCDRALLGVVEWDGQLRVYEPAVGTHDAPQVHHQRVPASSRPELAAAVSEAVFVGDVRALDDDERDALHRDVAAFASVPLVDPDDDVTLGVLAFTWDEPQRLRRPRRDLVLSVAAKVAETLQRIRAQESERLLQYQAAQLGQLTAALARATTTTDMADIVSRQADAAFAAQRAWMRVLDETTGQLMLVGSGTVAAGRRVSAAVDGTTPGGLAASTGAPVYVESRARMAELFPPETLVGLPGTDAVAAFPLHDHGRVAGTLTLAFERRVPFGEAECNTLETFAAVLGQTLERVRLAEHREGVAITLQHAMLGRPDDVESVAVSTAYRPADERLQVGGDWYDVIDLSGSRVGLVVGDVVGHHLEAAATMGQLRAALRALAVVLEDPAAVVRALERLVAHDDRARSSTLLYAVLDPERQTLRYCATGHPPPLLVHADGTSEFLLGGRGAPLGSYRPAEPQAATAPLPLGSTLVLYTDGLIERRRESLDAGLDRLAALAPVIATTPLGAVADALLDALLTGTREDDVAVLVARSAPVRLRRVLAGSPDELAGLRRDIRAWFEPSGVAASESEEMLVAIGEAVANAIEHAYTGTDGADRGAVEVEVHRSDADDGRARVCASVRDHGAWRGADGNGRDPDPTRGRGLHLMRAFCPEIEVRHLADGTEVLLAREFEVGSRRFRG